MEKRTCPECGEVINGRIDKKFCSDLCRNSYNNKINSDSNNYVRNVNNSLRKNRRLLEEALPKSDKITVAKQQLVDKGFNFNFYTHQATTWNNHLYIYCYEYGYMHLDNGKILIVKKEIGK